MSEPLPTRRLNKRIAELELDSIYLNEVASPAIALLQARIAELELQLAVKAEVYHLCNQQLDAAQQQLAEYESDLAAIDDGDDDE